MRKQFNVSTKAAIYNNDFSRVLTIYTNMSMNGEYRYGLPGGHIEDDESPDQTMARELHEECGIVVNNLRHADFFIHCTGKKLILAYVGSTDIDDIKSQQNEPEGIPKWLTRSEFEAIRTPMDENYRKLVLENWPKKNNIALD